MNKINIERARKFIASCDWIFAKTYAQTAPHEYIVREKLPADLQADFDWFANLIDHEGYEDKFYDATFTYLPIDSKKYWHMENLINRDEKGNKYK